MRRKHRKIRFAPRGYIILIVIATSLMYLAFVGTAKEQEPTVSEVPALESTVTVWKGEPMITESQCTEPMKKYSAVTMNDTELDELAEIIYHEARGESIEGQQAVAEVVFNRVIANNFPDTVHDVIHQPKQFSTAKLLKSAVPLQEQYDAINAALCGPGILPEDVVFFSRAGENDKVWGSIGDHVFCYQYTWD